MKKILLFIIMVAFLMLGGCTQNNGDIGDLFGFWRLTAFEVDGKPVDDFIPEQYVWAFQGRVVEITIYSPGHDVEHFYGTFSDRGDLLQLDFTHWKADQERPFQYHMPKALMLPDDEPLDMEVAERGEGHLVLTWNTQTYRFSKVY